MSHIYKVLGLSVPIVINLLLITMISFTDLYVVSKFGDDAVSGVGIVLNIWEILQALTIAFSSGATVLLTRYVGQESYQKGSLVISTLLITALASSLVMIALFALLPTMIVTLMDAGSEVRRYTVEYGYILLLDIPFIMINVVIDSALHSYGNSRVPMYLAAIAAVVNVILDFGLGLGMWGLPKMGVFGVALSTVIGFGIVAMIHLSIYFGSKTPYSPIFRFRYTLLKRALKVSLPEVGSRLVNRISNLIFVTAVITLGSSYYAAFTISMKLMAFGYMPLIAFAESGAILLGQEIGAKRYDEGKRYVNIVAMINLVMLIFIVSIFLIYAGDMAAQFSANAQTQKLTVLSIIVLAVTLFALAIDMTYTFALNGAGLSKRTFKINITTLWWLRIIPSLIAIYLFGSYESVLLSYAVQTGATAYLMYREFRKGEWRSVKV